jgi:hypothetical protein
VPVTREYPIREYSPHADQGWNNDDLPPSHPRYEETNTYGNLSNSWKIVLLMCYKSIGQLFCPIDFSWYCSTQSRYLWTFQIFSDIFKFVIGKITINHD